MNWTSWSIKEEKEEDESVCDNDEFRVDGEVRDLGSVRGIRECDINIFEMCEIAKEYILIVNFSKDICTAKHLRI